MASVIMPTKAMIAGRTASRVRVVSTDSRVLEGLLKIQDTHRHRALQQGYA